MKMHVVDYIRAGLRERVSKKTISELNQLDGRTLESLRVKDCAVRECWNRES